jgi:aryl-phospho-beta-D-glucosidase BglC (GH1 family)
MSAALLLLAAMLVAAGCARYADHETYGPRYDASSQQGGITHSDVRQVMPHYNGGSERRIDVSSNLVSPAHARGTFFVNSSSGWYGAAYYFPRGTFDRIHGDLDLAGWADAGGNTNTLRLSAADKKLRMYKGSTALSAAAPIREGCWNHIKMKQVVSPTAPENQLYVNDVLISSTTTGNSYGAAPSQVRFGAVDVDEAAHNEHATGYHFYVDYAHVSDLPIQGHGCKLESLHSSDTTAFLKPSNDEVRLNGVNALPFDGSGFALTQDQTDNITTKGYNAVRYVLHWKTFERTQGTWDETTFAKLTAAIARARKANLYVILNAIHLPVGDPAEAVPQWALDSPTCDPDATNDTIAIVNNCGQEFVREVAARYGSNVTVAAYDPVSEFGTTGGYDGSRVLDAYGRLYSTIRSVDPHTVILIGPAYGDANLEGGCLDDHFPSQPDLRGENNVAWSVHDYFAGDATGQSDPDGYTDSGAWPCLPDEARSNYTSAGAGYAQPDITKLERHLLIHKNIAKKHGLPIVVTEYSNWEGTTGRDAWVKDMVYLTDRHGIGRLWWEYRTPNANSLTDSGYNWKPVADLTFGPQTPTLGSTGDPVIAAAGDVSGTGSGDNATANLIRNTVGGNGADVRNPLLVLNLGDAQYETDGSPPGTLAEFNANYELSWGAFKHKTYFANGSSHDDYGRSTGTGGYFPYFSNYSPVQPINPTADVHPSYSFDVGDWHLISLDSYCFDNDRALIPDCAAETEAWLASDLANNTRRCILAFWHQPFYGSASSSHSWSAGQVVKESMRVGVMQKLYEYGADVVLTGHQHFYERMKPMNPNGDIVDPANGIRTFIVGTGGKSTYNATNVTTFRDTTSGGQAAFQGTADGVLKLTLHPTSYDFQYVTEAGQSFVDASQASVQCH